jgi:hypothetical protein
MRYPTTKRIADELSVTDEQAKRIRGLMDGSIDPETSPAVQAWLRQCHHRPRASELIMCAIDEAFETHGVEAIRTKGTWIDNYHLDIRAVYCNTGDTYAATVLLDHKTGSYLLTSWGDFVESRRL